MTETTRKIKDKKEVTCRTQQGLAVVLAQLKQDGIKWRTGAEIHPSADAESLCTRLRNCNDTIVLSNKYTSARTASSPYDKGNGIDNILCWGIRK